MNGLVAQSGPVIPDFGQASDCVQENRLFCPDWVRDNWGEVLQPALLQHVKLTIIAVVVGFVIAFVAALFARRRAWSRATSSRCCKEIHFPHSLGLLYSAFTYYTGFKVNSGEYKVMGLAPYGEPKYASYPRQSDRSQGGRHRSGSNHGLLRLLHRPDDDERAASTRCSAARRASRSSCSPSATWTSPPRSRR